MVFIKEFEAEISTGIDSQYYLLGLLSTFENQYQSKADRYFKDITWKQFLSIVCIRLFEESPTIGDLSEVIKTSHQNAKQILLKLEKKGYVELTADSEDKRKQRVKLTEKSAVFLQEHDQESSDIVGVIFQGIDQERIQKTIETIMLMERNLEKI